MFKNRKRLLSFVIATILTLLQCAPTIAQVREQEQNQEKELKWNLEQEQNQEEEQEKNQEEEQEQNLEEEQEQNLEEEREQNQEEEQEQNLEEEQEQNQEEEQEQNQEEEQEQSQAQSQSHTQDQSGNHNQQETPLTIMDASTRSLLPIQEILLEEIDLFSHTPQQLKETYLKDILLDALEKKLIATPISGVDFAKFKEATIFYSAEANLYDHNFAAMAELTEEITVFEVMERFRYLQSISFSVQMIIGSGSQTDMDNLRVTANILASYFPVLDDFGLLYSSDDSDLGYVELAEDITISVSEPLITNLYINIVGTDVLENVAPLDPTYEMRVYKGYYSTLEEAQANGDDITNDIIYGKTASNLGYHATLSSPLKVTVFIVRTDLVPEVTVAHNITISATASPGEAVSLPPYELAQTGNPGEYELVLPAEVFDYEIYSENSVTVYKWYMESKEDQEYYVKFIYDDGTQEHTDYVGRIEMAVEGHYSTKEQAQAEGKADIKVHLFDNSLIITEQMLEDTLYKTSLSGGVDFTVFTKAGETLKLKVIIQQKDPTLSGDSDYEIAYMDVTGFTGEAGKDIYNILQPEEGGYASTDWSTKYQELLIMDSSVDTSALAPTFSTLITRSATETSSVDEHVSVTVEGEAQTSGVTAQNFSGGPVLYKASPIGTPSGIDAIETLSYVNLVALEDGVGKLFVSGPEQRDIALYNFHDIIVANMGGAALTGVTATLTNAQNVKLDRYWNLNNSTIPAYGGEVSVLTHPGARGVNLAKVRLVPTDTLADGGIISGTLTIETAEGEKKQIELSGRVQATEIITKAIPEAVRYIPYEAEIEYTNYFKGDEPEFVPKFEAGEGFPDAYGFSCDMETGQITGVPVAVAAYSFDVTANYYYKGPTKALTFDLADTSTMPITLAVKDNTDENVNGQTSVGYSITRRIPNVTSNSDVTFAVSGGGEFRNLLLNGRHLVQNEDYTAEQTPTGVSIRIKGGTLSALGNGTHTLVAEFREGGTDAYRGVLKIAAQNFTKSSGTTGDNNGGNNGSSERSGRSGGRNESDGDNGNQPIPSEPEKPKTAAEEQDLNEAARKMEGLRGKKSAQANGSPIAFDTDQDGAAVLELTSDPEAIRKLVKDKELAIVMGGFDRMYIYIPAKSLEDGTMISIATYFGIVSFSGDELRDLEKRLGRRIRLRILRSSFDIAFIDENGKELQPNKGEVSFQITLPYRLAQGQKPEAVVVIDKTDGKNQPLPFSVYHKGAASFTVDFPGIYDLIYNGKGFSDIQGIPLEKSILFTTARGIFSGTGNGNFSPGLPMSRAMMVTILSRLEGIEAVTATEPPFRDMEGNEWFAEAVKWAKENGIVAGYGDGTFLPHREVSRQEVAVMLNNYINYKNVRQGIEAMRAPSTPEEVRARLVFSDKADIGDYAVMSVEILLGMGILSGRPNGSFSPDDKLLRSEAAVLIERTLIWYKE